MTLANEGEAMSELFRRTDCVIHLVPGIDAVTGDEACLRCGARRQWVVPVEEEETPMDRLEYRQSLGLDKPLGVGEVKP
jgi:hypothetical protein